MCPNLNCGRALEVGCGRGILTADILQYWYKTVDLFDKSRSACKFARQRFSKAKKVGMITQGTM